MRPDLDRREFLQKTIVTGALAAGALTRATAAQDSQPAPKELPFKISLAEWSLHRHLYGEVQPKLENLDFPKMARDFGIDVVEYVNQFFKDRADDAKYLAELNRRCRDQGVKNGLIMIDGEGHLGARDESERTKAVVNHQQWVRAAKALGCHTIRVNAHSEGTPEEQAKLVADGLHRLCEYGEQLAINIIVENHGGLSSNGDWLVGVMKLVNHPRCGTLPDFGNFGLGDGKEYDRYHGTEQMMPYARGVSAKSYDFDEAGNETKIDYRRMMKIVVAAGYHGYVGVEYEGPRLDEYAGIRATKALLEKIRTEMQA